MNPERVDALTEIISASCDDLQQSRQQPDNEIHLLSGIDHVENIAFAAQMVEMNCLEALCHEINHVLFESPPHNTHTPSERIKILTDWTQQVLAFLRKPDDPALAGKITSLLSEDRRQHYIEQLLNPNNPTSTSTSTSTSASTSASTPASIPTITPLPTITSAATYSHPYSTAATPTRIENLNNSSTEQAAPSSNKKDAIDDELLAVFLVELDEIHQQLSEIVNEISPAGNQDQRRRQWQIYNDFLQQIKETANLVKLLGVAQVCIFVEENIFCLTEHAFKGSHQALICALNQWIPLVENYLRSTENDEVIFDLINHLESSAWPKPLEESNAKKLLTLLVNYRASDVEQLPQEIIPSHATAEAVSLAIASDANNEIVSIFLSELPQQTLQLCQSIAQLNNEDNSHNADLAYTQHLPLAQRLAHTLKGASNLIGVKGIANLAHYLEDLLIALAAREQAPTAQEKGLLEEACDCIADMADELVAQPQNSNATKNPVNNDHLAVLQKILDFLNALPQATPTSTIKSTPLERDVCSDKIEALAPTSSDTSGSSNTFKTSNTSNASNTSNTFPVEDNSPQGQEQSDTLRVPVKIIESLYALVEELTIQMGSTHDKVKQLIKIKDELKQQDDHIQEKRFELESVVDVRGFVTPRNSPQPAQLKEFDNLEMDQFNEVHDVTHGYIESVADSREISLTLQEQLAGLDTLFAQQLRINKELQRQLKNTRLVPVSNIESRLQRCVRQACRTTGKQAEITFCGGETLINDEILAKLVDPLMHLLRNAVDHGIESQETRLKNNKPAKGHIEVSVSQRNQTIYIACQDDGAGISRKKILKKAQQKGFLRPEHCLNSESLLTDQQLTALIVQPGFSTRDQATQISGRGVGMNAVSTSVNDLGGTLHINSNEHFGTMVTLSIPIKLLATHALLIQSEKQNYAVPSRAISQIIPAGEGQLKIVGEKQHLEFNDELFETFILESLLKNNEAFEEDTTSWEKCPVLIIKSNQKQFAIRIDAALSSHELVIKSTGRYIQNIPGTLGVAILGDGSLVTLLDLNSLLQTHQNLPLHNVNFGPIKEPSTSSPPQRNTVLIVDDSLSVRRSLGQMMEDANYTPIMARDGLDAVEQLKEHQPDLLLVDLEMPRMNGIELTRYLRNNPLYASVPIFMVTSRSTTKHRNLAAQEGVTEYFTKPYTENDLLSKIHHHLNSHKS